MSIPYCKFNGFGNEYIVIERSAIPAHVAVSDLAIAISRTDTGVGSDGIAVLETIDEPDADYVCEIVNPDGSIAGFSGNGTRCAVAYLHYKKLWTEPALRLATRSGVKNYSLIEREGETAYLFKAEIGKPWFASDDVPVKTDKPRESVIDLEIELGDRKIPVACVNVGNPVACIFVDEFDLDWRVIGKELEVHQAFP